MEEKRCYGLTLADGSGWRIIAVEGEEGWLDKFAHIQTLEPCGEDERPRLVITRAAFGRNGCLNSLINRSLGLYPLPEDGWVAQDLGYMRILRRAGVRDVICEIKRGDRDEEFVSMWMSLFPVYQGVQEDGGLPFHAALIEREGEGVLLCAPGSTGKSTSCRRLSPPWRPLCDDETLVVKSGDGRYMAHPFPTWSDYLMRRSERTWRVERSIPLSALFFLAHAKTDEAVSVNQARASVMINQAAYQICVRGWVDLAPEMARELRLRLFDNACALTKAVPSFILKASLEGKFWEEMEKCLINKKGDNP